MCASERASERESVCARVVRACMPLYVLGYGARPSLQRSVVRVKLHDETVPLLEAANIDLDVSVPVPSTISVAHHCGPTP